MMYLYEYSEKNIQLSLGAWSDQLFSVDHLRLKNMKESCYLTDQSFPNYKNNLIRCVINSLHRLSGYTIILFDSPNSPNDTLKQIILILEYQEGAIMMHREQHCTRKQLIASHSRKWRF